MKQKSEKFDDLARNHVINAIQEHHGVNLQKKRRLSIWLRDASDRNWCVLGGIETWHGIPVEVVEDEKRAQLKGVFVIAYKKSTNIDVFEGPLGRLVSALVERRRATQPPRDYKFNVKVSGTRMRCIEARPQSRIPR